MYEEHVEDEEKTCLRRYLQFGELVVFGVCRYTDGSTAQAQYTQDFTWFFVFFQNLNKHENGQMTNYKDSRTWTARLRIDSMGEAL